jgi:hypothetical protein
MNYSFLFLRLREAAIPFYSSRSRYTALYTIPKTAVRASNAKNIVIINLHLLLRMSKLYGLDMNSA